MTSDEPVGTVFREGDPVVLASGTYQGTTGCFVRLKKGRQLGRHQGAQWQHPQPPNGMAGPFRGR